MEHSRTDSMLVSCSGNFICRESPANHYQSIVMIGVYNLFVLCRPSILTNMHLTLRQRLQAAQVNFEQFDFAVSKFNLSSCKVDTLVCKVDTTLL
jgi:hypothetical protein